MTDGQVVPFGRRRKPSAPTPAAEPLPGDGVLHPRTRRAAPAARQVVLEQTAQARLRYAEALAKQQEPVERRRDERLLAEGTPVPARITLALDVAPWPDGRPGRIEGPEVDEACGTWEGNPDGDVDAWEAGAATPTGEQVRLLSELTGFPIRFFYEPIQSGPLVGPGPAWVCGPRGCETVPAPLVDERGVLHYPHEAPRPQLQPQLFPTPAAPDPPAKPTPRPARRPTPQPQGSQLALPPARLSDEARANLLAQIEEAKKRRRTTRP